MSATDPLTRQTNDGRPDRTNWVDDVLADSFPASDPPSWTPGMARPAPAMAPSTARRMHHDVPQLALKRRLLIAGA